MPSQHKPQATPEEAILPTAVVPCQWPASAEPLSFSALKQLQICPRQWAYLHALLEPGGLVDDRGRLQTRASWAAFKGTVVHAVLEELLKVHQQHGGPPAGSWALVSFWKKHLPAGGVPHLVQQCLEVELTKIAGQVRNRRLLPYLRHQAAQGLGGLIAAVNGQLGSALTPGAGQVRKRAGHVPGTRRERPLARGTQAEVEVEASLGQGGLRRLWRGSIDAVRLDETGLRLIEFKTGEEAEAHREQLRLYALLLSRDAVLNPTGKLADVLSVVYSDGRAISFNAPSAEELVALEEQLTLEAEARTLELQMKPPLARPSADHCMGCAARPLCDAFWADPRVRRLDTAGERGARQRFLDLELTVRSLSPSRDELMCEPDVIARDVLGRAVRLLAPREWRSALQELALGERLRILGAERIPLADDDGPSKPVFTLGIGSELVRCRP